MKPVCLVIEKEGGSASSFLLDALEADSIGQRVAAVEAETGLIEVVVFNLGAQIHDGALKDTSYKAFEMGWRLATFAPFRTAAAVIPLMEQRGKGTILVTSATAAVRGNRGQHSHAAATGGWSGHLIGRHARRPAWSDTPLASLKRRAGSSEGVRA